MIQKHSVVKLTYELYLHSDEPGKEELFERAPEHTPLTYCHGIGMMLPLFEASLEGKKAGDTFDFIITASDAYGEHDERGVLTLDKEVFCIDGVFDEKCVKLGNIIPMNTTDGQVVRAQVVDIQPEKVTIDLNHPLAGEDLHFIGKVIEEHEASAEELESFLQPKCGGCGGGCKKGKGDCGNGGCGDCGGDCEE